MSGGLGVFVWGKRYIEKEKGRDAENKKRIKKLYSKEVVKNIKRLMLRYIIKLDIKMNKVVF